MLDIKFIRENPEIVKENIRKKFQEAKLPLVDEVIAQVGLNPGKVLSILTMLEIKGKICRLPGKRVAQKRG